MKEKIIISACLLGFDCKYDGGNNRMEDAAIAALRKRFELIPVCPECCGGLPTPRTPSERLGDRVVSKTGADVTEQFEKGALVPGDGVTAELLKKHGVRVTDENALL